MLTEDNKTLIRHFFEAVFNKKNLVAIEEFIAPSHIDHSAAAAGLPIGPEGSGQAIGMMLAAFPDLHVLVEGMVAKGDKLVVRMTMRGTQQGAFGSIPPNCQAGGSLDHRYCPHRRWQDRGRMGH